MADAEDQPQILNKKSFSQRNRKKPVLEMV